jgi:hypothetical protein
MQKFEDIHNTWHHGVTVPIRVPRVLAKKILRYARSLDCDRERPCEECLREFIADREYWHEQQPEPKRKWRDVRRQTEWKIFNECVRWIGWKVSNETKRF